MARSAATVRLAEVPAAKLRRIALEAQGLSKQAPFGRGRTATRRTIERIGYVQIDTISVVARAHDHVLHSRVPNYAPEHLDALQSDGSIFEYWFHAAAYLPMRDYRYALPHMQRMREGRDRWIRSRDQTLMRRVLDRVAAEGPLMARDFDTPSSDASGWWNWKPAKRALEQLFMQGDLMITGRQGFQKTYDLTERVLPAGTDTRMPDDAEMAAYLLRTMLAAHGFVTPKSVTYQRRNAGLRTALKHLLEEAVARDELVPIRLPGGDTAYADPERLETRAPPAAGRAVLLSPFDNLVIHRDRTRSVFDFDYQIECYVKASERRFGYFCLPIVYRDRLVGRADCKAHRGESRFEIRHLHLETDMTSGDEGFLPALSEATRRFATFNGCNAVSVSRVSPGALAPAVHRALDG